MTQIYITIAIIAIVGALVCYIFVKQTINEKKQEKDRLQRVLAKRAKDLLQMISVFPENFLPKEIIVFIYRCIIDAFEQLTKLAPTEAQYIEGLKVHSAQLEAIIRKPDTQKTEDIQNTAQINELRQYLNVLNGFLEKSVKRSHITQKQYGHYRLLIKELIIKLAVNNYILSAKQSLEIGKPKLALHHYELAKKLLTKETPTHYKDKIKSINTAMEPLIQQEQAQQAAESAQTAQAQSEAAENGEDGEWSSFNEDAGWKKKNVYD